MVIEAALARLSRTLGRPATAGDADRLPELVLQIAVEKGYHRLDQWRDLVDAVRHAAREAAHRINTRRRRST